MEALAGACKEGALLSMKRFLISRNPALGLTVVRAISVAAEEQAAIDNAKKPTSLKVSPAVEKMIRAATARDLEERQQHLQRQAQIEPEGMAAA